MNHHPNQARVVDGHLVRDDAGTCNFSFKRFLLVMVLASLMIITNPANELYDKAVDVVDKVLSRNGTSSRYLQQGQSEWDWSAMMDPPISITNYGIFTVEERHAKMDFLGLTKSWSCPYFDEQKGSICSALARNLCHGKPLLRDPKSYAYTAHRAICFLLISAAVLSFCYGGQFPAPLATEPFLRAILHSFGRAHFSPLSLGLDLFNASNFVYPALVRMEKIVPTLEEGGIASLFGLPKYADFIFYVVVLVLFLGGGSNTLASYFTRRPCLGFDSSVAAAVGYSSAFSSPSSVNSILSPQAMLWAYLPITAVLGGSFVSWILGGMFGVMLAQYHLDNQNLLLAIKQTIFSAF